MNPSLMREAAPATEEVCAHRGQRDINRAQHRREWISKGFLSRIKADVRG
jgi:hypothetical protein